MFLNISRHFFCPPQKKSFRLHELFIFSSMRWQFLQQNHQAFLATKNGLGESQPFWKVGLSVDSLEIRNGILHFLFLVDFLVSEIWFETCRLWVLWNKNGFKRPTIPRKYQEDVVMLYVSDIIYVVCSWSSYFLDFLSTIPSLQRTGPHDWPFMLVKHLNLFPLGIKESPSQIQVIGDSSIARGTEPYRLL